MGKWDIPYPAKCNSFKALNSDITGENSSKKSFVKIISTSRFCKALALQNSPKKMYWTWY